MDKNCPVNVIPHVYDKPWDYLQNNECISYDNNDLSIYIHFPFCRKKCAFCQIQTFIYSTDLVSSYLRSLKIEIDRYASFLSKHNVNCIHFGGGTPSIMSVRDIESILQAIQRYTEIDGAEIEFEANPMYISDEIIFYFSNINHCTVNFGVQSFCDSLVAFVDRQQQTSVIQKNMEAVKDKVSAIGIDLICGLPNSNKLSLTMDMNNVFSLQPDQVSVYPLNLNNTALSNSKRYQDRKSYSLPNEEEKISMMGQYSDCLFEQGYHRYSIYHYEKEEKCISGYGRNQINNGIWIGFGALSYSYLGNRVYVNNSMDKYIKGFHTEKQMSINYTERMVWELSYIFRRVSLTKEHIMEKYGTIINFYFDQILDELFRNGYIDSKDFPELTWKGIIHINSVEEIIERVFLK